MLQSVVAGPSTVAVWRAVWDSSREWLDDEICQGDSGLANVLALLGGLLVTSIVDLVHGDLAGYVGALGGVAQAVARHAFSFTWGFADIMMWKGLWEGYDYFAGLGLHQSLVTSVLGLAVLLSTTTLKSAMCPPVRFP